MTIAIYYPWIYLTSGVERTILELATNRKHSYTIFTNHYEPNHTFPEFKRLKVIELRRIPVERNLFSVFKAALIIATQKIDLSSFDMLMVHCDGLGDLIQIQNHHLPVICICHTPLRISFDRFYIRQKPHYRIFGSLFKILDRRLWRNYSAIVFNSRETYHRALTGKLIARNQKNISIVHPGIHWNRIKPSGVFKPYFLLPGRIMWTKNIELGITTFIRAKNTSQIPTSFYLVIAGQVDTKSQIYLQKLQSLTHHRPDISFVTNPTDRKLSSLYSYCWATLQCAFNEDWGLTCLEAGTWAKPVITVDRGGPRESILNNKTGLLVPTTKEAFTQALIKIANSHNQAQKLGFAGRKHVKQYDWKYFINQIDQVINSV